MFVFIVRFRAVVVFIWFFGIFIVERQIWYIVGFFVRRMRFWVCFVQGFRLFLLMVIAVGDCFCLRGYQSLVNYLERKYQVFSFIVGGYDCNLDGVGVGREEGGVGFFRASFLDRQGIGVYGRGFFSLSLIGGDGEQRFRARVLGLDRLQLYRVGEFDFLLLTVYYRNLIFGVWGGLIDLVRGMQLVSF